jgi:hypothetical protein
MEFSKRIAESLNLSEEDINLATLIGLLHDIGRFEQCKIAHSYNDLKSGIDHANLAVKVLFEENKILDFLPETREFDGIIKTAVEQHNKFAIKDGITERENLHSKIIRDADKIDILNIHTMATEEYNPVIIAKNSGFELNSNISPEILDALFENKQVDRSHIKYFLDWYINTITFLFDVNYSESFKIIKSKGFIEKTIEEGIKIVPERKDLLIKIEKHMEKYIDERIEN